MTSLYKMPGIKYPGNAYILLTEFAGRTVSYGPIFSPSREYRLGHKSKGENEVP